MKRIEYRHYAPENTVFSPGAFDSSVGGFVPFGQGHVAEVISAEVSEDGSYVTVTIAAADAAMPHLYFGGSI